MSVFAQAQDNLRAANQILGRSESMKPSWIMGSGRCQSSRLGMGSMFRRGLPSGNPVIRNYRL